MAERSFQTGTLFSATPAHVCLSSAQLLDRESTRVSLANLSSGARLARARAEACDRSRAGEPRAGLRAVCRADPVRPGRRCTRHAREAQPRAADRRLGAG